MLSIPAAISLKLSLSFHRRYRYPGALQHSLGTLINDGYKKRFPLSLPSFNCGIQQQLFVS